MIKISQTISPVLSNYLRAFTSKRDIADVANKLDRVSPSTVRDVMYGSNAVTENNLPALRLLILKASENADAKIKLAKSFKKEIQKELDLI